MGKTSEQSQIPDWNVVDDAVRTSLLRFSTAGSVDDGKSTLIGRLLHDTGNIYDDHLEALRKKSATSDGNGPVSLALLTDGLKAEREQGITIDVAYRYFATKKRWFILADSPGHEQYTRNMATGASTADLTIIVVDAQKGVVTQTRRHAFIASLLGVPRLLVAVNKMDLVDFSKDVFDRISADFTEFAAKLGVREVRFVPIAALLGDNVVHPSKNMPWYRGETVMDYLENVYVAGDINQVDFRFPVQYVIRPNQNFRGFAGQILSGHVRVGDEVMTLPSLKRTKVKSIDVDSRDPAHRSLDSAFAPMSVVLTLEDEIDISRGDMLVRSKNVPSIKHHFEAMVIWTDEEPLDTSCEYIIRHTTRESKLFVEQIHYRVDINELSRIPAKTLSLNEVGRVSFTSTKPLFLDPYRSNRLTGCFVLISPDTYKTVAAGLVIERLPNEIEHQADSFETSSKASLEPVLHKETGFISREAREKRSGFRALTIWCTGLSGSGKSSIAKELEKILFRDGRPVFRLDGDTLRSGLNKDLGFSPTDRTENIRRTAEVARILNEAGVTVICSFISPYERDREAARATIGAENFVEVFVDAPLAACETRDPHGLYKKARAGKIPEFTGISSPYEAPKSPDIRLDTAGNSLEQCVENLYEWLRTHRSIRRLEPS